MKKRIIAFLTFAVMVLAISANAAITRAPAIQPGLSINGTQANCSLIVLGDMGDEEISATIKLKRGLINVATWHEDGVGELVFSDTVTVSTGKTYTLTADVTIDGTTYPTVSMSKTN